MTIHKKLSIAIPSTARIEAFSDGIFAFVATLLVIELVPPHLESMGALAVLESLQAMWPKFFTFASSFFSIVIVWVNHHHFFHQLERSDAKLLWGNNFLLFFLTLIPFTTAFLGDYPWEPMIAFIYSFVMLLAVISFYFMVHYAFLRANLLGKDFPVRSRKREVRRALMAVTLYTIACGLAFIYEPITLVMIVLIPLLYFVPTVIESDV